MNSGTNDNRRIEMPSHHRKLKTENRKPLYFGRIIAFCLLGLLITALTGCAVGPDYQRPKAMVPETWAGVPKAAGPEESKANIKPIELIEWWTAFNDPLLTSLVERAIDANLDVKLAESRIRQARAAAGVAGAGLWPRLDAKTLYKRSMGSSESVSSSGASAISTTPGLRELFQVGLDASWEIDIFGGLRRNLEAAGADLEAAVEDRRDVLVTLVGELGNNYLNLRGFQQQVAIARKNLEAQKRTAEITRQRWEAGFISALDVDQAQAQVATTESQIPVFESAARLAIYTLSLLLGREPATLLPELVTDKPIPPTPPEVPVGLPSELLRRRPDIRRVEAQIHAATARIGVATADLFPKFALTGSFGLSSSEFTKVTTWNSKYWSFGPAITWPVFAGGRIRWNIKVQEALQEQSLLSYEKTILTALKDVESVLVAYAKEQQRRQSLVEAVTKNRKAVDRAMQLYTVGRTDFLNVLIAQRSLFTSEDAWVQSTRTVDTNLIALYKALGGGWENKSNGKK
jgi:NodT family efflux transporter outer membrane factor (OMF) lipoprotein